MVPCWYDDGGRGPPLRGPPLRGSQVAPGPLSLFPLSPPHARRRRRRSGRYARAWSAKRVAHSRRVGARLGSRLGKLAAGLRSSDCSWRVSELLRQVTVAPAPGSEHPPVQAARGRPRPKDTIVLLAAWRGGGVGEGEGGKAMAADASGNPPWDYLFRRVRGSPVGRRGFCKPRDEAFRSGDCPRVPSQRLPVGRIH